MSVEQTIESRIHSLLRSAALPSTHTLAFPAFHTLPYEMESRERKILSLFSHFLWRLNSAELLLSHCAKQLALETTELSEITLLMLLQHPHSPGKLSVKKLPPNRLSTYPIDEVRV